MALASVALWSLFLACLVTTSAWSASESTPPGKDMSFEYLYIVANEGSSSGGHTAIRFGRDVYHFQNEKGLLVLRRDRADEFFFEYALLDNRAIHSTRIAVSRETYSGLVDQFRRRHRAQEAQIGVGTGLREDRILLERFRDHAKTSPEPPSERSLAIPGLGYFESQPSDQPAAESNSIGEIHSETLGILHEAVLRAHGPKFLAKRRGALLEALRTLVHEDPVHWAAPSPTSAYDHPPFARAYSSRWVDLTAGLAALDVLENARRLEITRQHAPDGEDFALDTKERQTLKRIANDLRDRLVSLVSSRREDWGQTLLVGMARLSALDRSVASGHLVFLDSFPDTTKFVDKAILDRQDDVGTMMLLENQRQFEGARAYLRDTEDAGELAWERLEERSNRFFEIRRALRENADLRVARGHLVPSRAALYPLPLSLAHDPAQLADDIEGAVFRERDYSNAMRRIHRYRLLDQNCATALFETINDSFGGSIESSREHLGGHVASRNALSFIPFISAREVNDRYTVVARETIPSYRQMRLRTMRNHESSFRVALRESNTFTATAYERSPSDSFFVFFTDNAPLLRPLLGAVNLTAALFQSVLGIATAPIDHGSHLTRGLRGAFVSLPELVFANIRKGSNDWIPREHRSLEPLEAEIDASR